MRRSRSDSAGRPVHHAVTAYTSPNARFTTVKEVLFKVSQGSRFAPYGLIAFESSAEPGVGQAEAVSEAGTYMELGVGPSWPLGGGRR